MAQTETLWSALKHGDPIERRAQLLTYAATRLARLRASEQLHIALHKSAESALGTGTHTEHPSGVLETLSYGVGQLTALEQQLSAKLPRVALPAFPALRVGDVAQGVPHAHGHPPNLVPPSPTPIPLPSLGPVLAIPFLSGASKTWIEAMPAARCGDIGLGMFCGGYFPMFELFLGSSSVWTEGARQARMAVDITKHCVFSAPKPNDPPLGPMFGTTISGATHTLVGGVPLPSLTNMAIGQAIKGLFKGVGALINRLHGRLVVARFLVHASVQGDAAFQKTLRNDLHRIARTATGRRILNELAHSGQPLTIRSPDASAAAAATYKQYADSCEALSSAGHVSVARDPEGPYLISWADGTTARGEVTGKNSGSGSTVTYDPDTWPRQEHPGSPSDVVLAHELNHANNNASGSGQAAIRDPDPEWQKHWGNHEEANTIGAENAYRAERGGVPQRTDYSVLP
jgi:hypothetical protein